MLSLRIAAASFFLCAQAMLLTAHAQNGGASVPAQKAPYTFQTTTRVVLTDVTVTDKKGNPVTGLKAGDFRIFDNNKPQTIASFEEHKTAPVKSLPAESTSPGVYSNSYLLHFPPVVNVIVLDITNMNIPDQMYLDYRLTRFFKTLPPGEPLAIYWCTGPTTILLQSFTADRDLLLAALHRAFPNFPPTGREYYSDLQTLHQIAVDLSQIPGRKNILWYSGGSTLFLLPDADGQQYPQDWRYVYDELETSRIAIYPIDARGLTVHTSMAMFGQQAEMGDIAAATGGRAFYNNNGLARIADHLLKTDGSFYTLTYSPQNFHFDNKWHKVRVQLVDGGTGYYLSYRRGYFADGSSAASRPSQSMRTRLLANGSTVRQPDLRSVPIIFQANVVQGAAAPSGLNDGSAAQVASLAHPPRKTVACTVHYVLPADAFTEQTVNNKPQFIFGVAVLAFNKQGLPAGRHADKIVITPAAQDSISAKTIIPINEHVYLHPGNNYLYLAVWDMTSGRLGTLQIPLTIDSPGKKPKR